MQKLYSYARLYELIQNKPLWLNKLVCLNKPVLYNEEFVILSKIQNDFKLTRKYGLLFPEKMLYFQLSCIATFDQEQHQAEKNQHQKIKLAYC